MAAATVLLLAAGGLAVRFRPGGRSATPLRAQVLTTFPGPERYPSLSPDGSYVAFTWAKTNDDAPDVYVQMIGSGPPLQLTSDPAGELNPVWSPDGRWIAFLRPLESSSVNGRAEVRLVAPLGGAERRVAEVWINTLGNPGTPAFLAWCPDSTCLIAADGAADRLPLALVAISLQTGAKRPLTSPKLPSFGDCNPAVSWDGRWLAFRRVPGPSAGELHRVRLGPDATVEGESERLTPGRLNAAYPAWLPDDRGLVFAARGSLWRREFSAAPLAPPEPERLAYVGEDGTMPVVSRAGSSRGSRLAYVRSIADSNIWRFQAAASAEPALAAPVLAISSTRQDITPHLSPDLRRLAFASSRSGVMEIWTADLDGGNAVALTALAAQSTSPRWSPDGRMVAFQSNAEGQFDVFLVPAAGGEPRNLTSHPANDFVPSFSRDGRWVYFSSTRGDGSFHAWKVPVEGGEAVQVTTRGGHRPLEAPDGSVYYAFDADSPTRVLRLPPGGGEPETVLESIVGSAYALVDDGVCFVDRRANEWMLLHRGFAGGEPRVLARNLNRPGPLITATPDGRTVFVSLNDFALQDLMLVEDFR